MPTFPNLARQTIGNVGNSIGLGDAVAAITQFFGVRPCGGCKKRQAFLNWLVPFKRQRILAAVTTAPRGTDTLSATLASIEAAGFGEPIVFAEPGCKQIDYEHVYRYPQRMGSWWSFLAAMRALLSLESNATHLAIFQDDIAMPTGLWDYVRKDLPEGVASLYVSGCQANNYPGWHRMTKSWGALAYVIDVESAKRIAAKGDANRGRYQTDGNMKRTCAALDIPMWQHTPSYVLHTGNVSAIGGDRGLTVGRQCKEWVRSIDPWEVIPINHRTNPFEYLAT